MRLGWPCVGVWLAALLFAASGYGARPATTFLHLDTADGLPAQTVWAIAQDRSGFMWFGTSNGLARYDGTDMQVFRHRPDQPGSLVSDDINALHVDQSGRLWVATSEGLCEYKPTGETFECSAGPENRLRSVADIAESQAGVLWLAAGGLVRFDTATKLATHLPASGEDFALSVAVDGEQRIWLGMYDHGLKRSDDAGATFKTVELGVAAGEERTLLHQRVRDIVEDSRGFLWVASDAGLTRLTAQGELDSYFTYNYDQPESLRSLSDHYVNTIVEDAAGDIWVGTYRGGLNRYSYATGNFTRYQSVPGDNAAPGSMLSNAATLDRTGSLWFAGRGVDFLDLDSEKLMRHAPADTHSAAGVVQTAEHLGIDEAGTVYLGSRAGLVRYAESENETTGEEWSVHLPVPEHPDYPDNSVYALGIGSDGFCYIGGPQIIWMYLEARRGYPSPASGVSVPGTPRAILSTRDGRLWAGTQQGLVAFGNAADEPDHTVLQPDAADTESLHSGFINALAEDRTGRIWVATQEGLSHVDSQSLAVTRIETHESGASRSVSSVAMHDGHVWFGTDDGLFDYHTVSKRLRHVTIEDGLPHNLVNAVAVDGDGTVWVGTDAGLARYEPASGSVRTLRRRQGLPDDEVLRLEQHPDGRLFVLTHGGLVSLNPQVFARVATDLRPTLLNFSVSGEPAPVVVAYTERGREITLSHRARVLTLATALLDYRSQRGVKHRHRLEGIDPDWVSSARFQNQVSYSTLPPGGYTFRYQARGLSGRWLEGDALHIHVAAAPWLTPWAYAAYAVLLFGLGLALLQWRTRLLRRRAIELEQQVADRTQALAQQSATVQAQGERLQELVEAKDRLYANVSHEFRTPLTVILGPIERMLRDDASPERRRSLEVVQRNASRLLRLVDQLMSVARIDAQRTVLQDDVDFSSVVEHVVASLQTLASDKHLIVTHSVAAGVWVRGDAEALERVVVNLLSNAIKYTPEGGDVHVSVTVQDEQVAFSVSDSGIGIDPDEQAKVFDRFYRAGDNQESSPGTGLGLAITREIVVSMGGSISLESRPGEGTTVAVDLPLGVRSVDVVQDVEVVGSELLETMDSAADSLVSSHRLDDAAPLALVVEDNPDLCWHIAEVLSDQVQCAFAHDGENGIRLAGELVPDIVICDVVLPGSNGFDVTRRIKEDDRTSHIPIILLTARADEESRLSGLRALADAYMTKPFNSPELKQRVDTLIAIREILRQRFAQLSEIGGTTLPDGLGRRDQRFLERLHKVLDERFSDPDFSVAEFANHAAMSERQLQRKLKALTGASPREYLRRYRLQQALPRLQHGEPVGSVAFIVGFSSQSYFSSCFRAQYGLSPSEYVNQLKEQAQ